MDRSAPCKHTFDRRGQLSLLRIEPITLASQAANNASKKNL